MHECIKTLINNVESPEEEDIESLCKLLMTVGPQLEASQHAQAKYMDIYFTRLQEIVTRHSVPSRLEFMILDLIDTRKSGWRARTAAAGPKSIAQIHKDSVREKEEEARRVSSQGRLPPRNVGMERGGSRRGQNREGPGADGWTQATVAPKKAGDLSTLGKIRGNTSSPALAGLQARSSSKQSNRDESPAAAANPFAALAGDDGNAPELSPPPEEQPTRPILKLKPRTVDAPASPVITQEGDDAEEEGEEGEVAENAVEEAAGSGEMTEAIRRSIDNSVKEYLGVRNVEEGKATFSELDEPFRGELAKAFITKIIDGKAVDIDAVVKLFAAVGEESIVPSPQFRDAFVQAATDLEDIATDAPKAFETAGRLMAAAALSEDDVKHLQSVMVSNEDMLDDIQNRLLASYKSALSVSVLDVKHQRRG